MANKPTYEFFATAAKGTEPALRDELRWLKFSGVRADRGGVHFKGEFSEGMRACLWSRIALRVLCRVATFEAPTPDALYEGAHNVDWSEFLNATTTLAVTAHIRSSLMTHSGAVALRVKDAVVDTLRDKFGARPNVEKHDPDVHIVVHLAKDYAELYVDFAGESLHKRGYRREAREAPLRENLAASMLWLGGWDQRRPLADPMCGSGTILIEAAGWARRQAPGLSRKAFGFTRSSAFDETHKEEWQKLLDDANARLLPLDETPEIWGGDIDPRAVELAKRNAALADVKITFEVADVADLAPAPVPGQIVVNPPYGVRLVAQDELYDNMARTFQTMQDHRITVLADGPGIETAMGQRPSGIFAVFNGDLECRIFNWDITGQSPRRKASHKGRL